MAFEEEEDTLPDDIACGSPGCMKEAIYRCAPDADYPVQDDEELEVFLCEDHVGLGLSYPSSWPGPPRGWRVEFIDVLRDGLPN